MLLLLAFIIGFLYLYSFIRSLMKNYINTSISHNIKLFVKDSGTGKPIVFISGWPFDHRSYEYQFNQIPEAGFRCIGIDMRGFGKSDKPYEEYNYDIFVSDLHRALGQLNLKDVTLVGHSMGGAISLHYAAKYPNSRYVSKLVLCGAAAPSLMQRPNYPYGFTKEELDDLLKQCNKDRAKLLTDFLGNFFYSKLTPELLNWIWITGMEASPYATSQCIKLFETADLYDDMSKVTIPTLILHGKHDKICSYEFAKILNKSIANSKLVTFEESGHGLFYDQREKFNKEIIDFAK